jgi:hypothetical protein
MGLTLFDDRLGEVSDASLALATAVAEARVREQDRATART